MEPLTTVAGPVTVLDRADVDTDQIIPKQFLKRIERTGFADYLFYDWKKAPGWDLPSRPILATGPNFGCGSSREQAPWAIAEYGFRVLVAASFGDIFYSNCTKNGLLPAVLPEAGVRRVMEAGEAVVDLPAQEVRAGGEVFPFEIAPEIKEHLLTGADEIELTLAKREKIEAFERAVGAPHFEVTR
jgi:3-isopropylmalate/(R)-2-methylmalate dehydratase small subunit